MSARGKKQESRKKKKDNGGDRVRLHETIEGRRFFEQDLLELIKQLKRIADNLEKMNGGKEQ